MNQKEKLLESFVHIPDSLESGLFMNIPKILGWKRDWDVHVPIPCDIYFDPDFCLVEFSLKDRELFPECARLDFNDFMKMQPKKNEIMKDKNIYLTVYTEGVQSEEVQISSEGLDNFSKILKFLEKHPDIVSPLFYAAKHLKDKQDEDGF